MPELQDQDLNAPWGAKTLYYDGVGNRTQEISTPTGGATMTDVLGYPSTSNRVVQITRGTTTTRSLTYDNAGNLLSDTMLKACLRHDGAAGNKAYVYNKRNRLSQATVGALVYNYTCSSAGFAPHHRRGTARHPRASLTRHDDAFHP